MICRAVSRHKVHAALNDTATPLRVCMVAPSILPLFDENNGGTFGGAEVRASLFIQGLVERGCEVSAVVLDDNAKPPRKVRGVNLITLPREALNTSLDRATNHMYACLGRSRAGGEADGKRCDPRLLVTLPYAVVGRCMAATGGAASWPARGARSPCAHRGRRVLLHEAQRGNRRRGFALPTQWHAHGADDRKRCRPRSLASTRLHTAGTQAAV